MTYSLLDTDTLTAFLHGKEDLVERVVAAIKAESLAITVITVQEQIDGRYAFLQRARTDAQLAYAYQNLTDAVRALSGLHIVTFSEAAIRRYNALLAMKLNIGKMDLRIARLRWKKTPSSSHATCATSGACPDWPARTGRTELDWIRSEEHLWPTYGHCLKSAS